MDVIPDNVVNMAKLRLHVIACTISLVFVALSTLFEFECNSIIAGSMISKIILVGILYVSVDASNSGALRLQESA